MAVSNSETPHKQYSTSSRGSLLLTLLLVILGIRPGPEDLLTNTALQPLDDAPNALGTQTDSLQEGDFLTAHPQTEVEPEDQTISFPVGPR